MSDSILLYGHADELGDDPHARIIELSRGTAMIVQTFQEEERHGLGRWEVGGFVTVKDVTGTSWEVASAPCGQPCHCAAIIRRAVPEGGI
jgi:hypothetical protein